MGKLIIFWYKHTKFIIIMFLFQLPIYCLDGQSLFLLSLYIVIRFVIFI